MTYSIFHDITLTEHGDTGDITHMGISSQQLQGIEAKCALPVTDNQPDYKTLIKGMPEHTLMTLVTHLEALTTAIRTQQKTHDTL